MVYACDLSGGHSYTYWTAGHRSGRSMMFEWWLIRTKDNSFAKYRMNYNHWLPAEPNNASGNEDCMSMYAVWDYGWNDCACHVSHYFICETRYM